MILPKFVGDQTPRTFDENSSVYFFSRIMTPTGVSVPQLRVPLNATKHYKNIEDILIDVSILPIDRKVWTVEDLKNHIRADALVGFAEVFEEWSIVAWAGRHTFDKPIAFVNDPNGAYYVAHPQIKKYVKRVEHIDSESDV